LVPDFETHDGYQVETFQRAGLLVKGVGDLAVIPVIDNNGEMSSGFSVSIGKIKKLLVTQNS
jgi:hypothetical protein